MRCGGAVWEYWFGGLRLRHHTSVQLGRCASHAVELFKKYVTQFNLPTGLVKKNSNTNAPVNRLDAQFSRELPT